MKQTNQISGYGSIIFVDDVRLWVVEEYRDNIDRADPLKSIYGNMLVCQNDYASIFCSKAVDDIVVTVNSTKTMAKKLSEAGKTDFNLTIYPAALHRNHFCWGYAFNDPDMPEWLFRQHL